MTVNIDKQWFLDRLAAKGLSLRKTAKLMDIDPSALSRMLNRQRKMKVSEIQTMAGILGTSDSEILAHVDDKSATTAVRSKTNATAAPINKSQPARISDHPGFGFMKGLIKIEEGFDVAGPFDDEPWDEGYLGEDRL